MAAYNLPLAFREGYGFLSPGSEGTLDTNGGQEAWSLAPSGKNSYPSSFCSTIETQLVEVHLHPLKNTAADSRIAKNNCRLYYFISCDILRT